MKPKYFIIDFDSTFVTVEALDELARLALEKNTQKDRIISQIEETTALGMEGKIPFHFLVEVQDLTVVCHCEERTK